MIDSLHFLSLALNDGDNASLPAAGKLVTATLKRGRERGQVTIREHWIILDLKENTILT